MPKPQTKTHLHICYLIYNSVYHVKHSPIVFPYDQPRKKLALEKFLLQYIYKMLEGVSLCSSLSQPRVNMERVMFLWIEKERRRKGTKAKRQETEGKAFLHSIE